MRRILILSLIFLVCMTASARGEELITVENEDVIIQTNYSTVCNWSADQPMRKCYQDFIVINKGDKSLSYDKNINYEFHPTSLTANKKLEKTMKEEKFDSKSLIPIDDDKIEKSKTYRIEFEAPPNYHEKWNFSVNINGKEIFIDPDVSACSNIVSSGTYNITGNITANGVYCFTLNADDITFNGNDFWIIRGTDLNHPFRTNSDYDNITINDLNVDESDSGFFSCYNYNCDGLYVNNCSLHLTDEYDLWGGGNNIIIDGGYWKNTETGNPTFKYHGQHTLIKNVYFETTAHATGFIRPSRALGDHNFTILDSVINITTSNIPIIWADASERGWRFINSTFIVSPSSSYKMFDLACTNDLLMLEMNGTTINASNGQDMFLTTGSYNNGTIQLYNNYYGNTTNTFFSDTCIDANKDEICDEWFEPTGLTGIYDQYAQSSYVAPPYEVPLVEILDPTNSSTISSIISVVANVTPLDDIGWMTNVTLNYTNGTFIKFLYNESENGNKTSISFDTTEEPEGNYIIDWISETLGGTNHSYVEITISNDMIVSITDPANSETIYDVTSITASVTDEASLGWYSNVSLLYPNDTLIIYIYDTASLSNLTATSFNTEIYPDGSYKIKWDVANGDRSDSDTISVWIENNAIDDMDAYTQKVIQSILIVLCVLVLITIVTNPKTANKSFVVLMILGIIYFLVSVIY